MPFQPSPYSENFEPREDYGASVPGIPDVSSLINQINSIQKNINKALPMIKFVRDFIRKVKPKSRFGKLWRPRWKLWQLIHKKALPPPNKAIKDMGRAKKDLAKTKAQLKKVPG